MKSKKGIAFLMNPYVLVAIVIIGGYLYFADGTGQELALDFTHIVNPEVTIDDTWNNIPLSGTIHTESGSGSRSASGSASYSSSGHLIVGSSATTEMNSKATGWLKVNVEQDISDVDSVEVELSGTVSMYKSHHDDRNNYAHFYVYLVDEDGDTLGTIYSKSVTDGNFDTYDEGTRTETLGDFTITKINDTYTSDRGTVTTTEEPVYLQFYSISGLPSYGRGGSASSSGTVAEIIYNVGCSEDELGACNEESCLNLGLYWRSLECKSSECTQDYHCEDGDQCVNNVCELIPEPEPEPEVEEEEEEEQQEEEQEDEQEEETQFAEPDEEEDDYFSYSGEQTTLSSIFNDVINWFAGLFNLG